MNIISGEERSIQFSFALSAGGFYSLVDTVELEIRFPGQEEPVVKKYTDNDVVISLGGGEDAEDIATVNLQEVDTALLNIGLGQRIEIVHTVGTVTRIFQPLELINVVAQLYPPVP